MPVTVTRNPLSVHENQDSAWVEFGSAGGMVPAVSDSSDSTGVTASLQSKRLTYKFETIKSLGYFGGSLVTACNITHRIFWNEDEFSGSGFTAYYFTTSGSTWSPGGAPPSTDDRVHNWAASITTVDLFDEAAFGGSTTWTSTGPDLLKLSASVTFEPELGGFVFAMASLGPMVAIGVEHMSKITSHLWSKHGVWFPASDYARALAEYKAQVWPTLFLS